MKASRHLPYLPVAYLCLTPRSERPSIAVQLRIDNATGEIRVWDENRLLDGES